MHQGFEKELADNAIELIEELLASDEITIPVLQELSDLEDKLAVRTRRLSGKTGLTYATEAKLLADANDMIDLAYSVIAGIHEDGLVKVARKTYGIEQKNISEVAEVEFSGDRGLTGEVLKTVGTETITMNHTNEEWWAAQDKHLRERFEAEIKAGMLKNENLEDMIKRIRGTQANGFTDGIMSLPRHQAEALVRTSIVNVGNQARLAMFAENRDVIKAVEWLATLDERTTVICETLSGKQWYQADDPFDYEAYKPIGHKHKFPGPTAHWNCRSVQVPVMWALGEMEKVAMTATGREDYPLEGTQWKPYTFKNAKAKKIYDYIKKASSKYIAAQNAHIKALEDTSKAGQEKAGKAYEKYAPLEHAYITKEIPKIRKMLTVDDPAPLIAINTRDMDDDMVKPLTIGTNDIRLIAHKDFVKKLFQDRTDIKFHEGLPSQMQGTSAFYQAGDESSHDSIFIRGKMGIGQPRLEDWQLELQETAFHEVTHKLMNNTGLWKKEMEFYLNREPLMKHAEGLAPELRPKSGSQYSWMDDYMSTWYGKRPSYQGDWYGFEVMTRAVQYYWYQPEFLAAKDPELFEFVLKTLQKL